MNSARASVPVHYGTPPIRSISVAGTTTFQGDRDHAFALARFKEWLRARHQGAAVTVRCRWRPEEYGRVKVKITTVIPLPEKPARHSPEEEPARLIWIEQALIEEVWREEVGWGRY
jgi:hypothetical protein